MTLECVHIGNAALYRADSLEVLPTISDADVNVVVTDPPYGVMLGGVYA